MLLRQICHYSVSTLRFALCLLCAATCVFFAGMWLGLVPDPDRVQRAQRAQLVDSVARHSLALIERHQWRKLEYTLDVMTLGNPQVESIGFRNTNDALTIGTGDHELLWHRGTLSRDRLVHLVTDDDGPVGSFEFCFAKSSSVVPITKESQVTLFVIAAIYLVHFFFTWWIPRSREAIQVVPDRVRQALDTLSEGVLLLDVNERIILANQAFAKMCDSTEEALLGRKASSLPWIVADNAHPEEFPWVDAMVQQQPQLDRRLHMELPGGHQRVFSVISKPTTASRRKHRGALATFRDVTEVVEHRAQLESMLVMLKSNRDEISRKNEELQILATRDSLTGCLNRRAFFERFDAIWKKCRQTERPLACIMVDNDHFKSINDTYGHHTGDIVLIRVAETLREKRQEGHLVCRYGGEEFCIALPGVELEHAAQIAEQIREAITELKIEGHDDLRLSASLGVSELQFGASAPQDLINEADQALYAAKNSGRNTVICYHPEMAQPQSEQSASSPANEPANEAEIPYSAVSILLSGLSYRDSDTANHCRRVADFCVAAAKGVLSPRETYLIELAAQLHDIGKIGVPDELLLSTEPLTDEQWRVMAQHERLGVELIHETFDNPELAQLVQAARAHFDGSGRNQGLPQGEEIPIAARLLAIADSFDAMVTDRPYRRGRSFAEAFAELRRCGGTQFDPQLVEHFIQAIEARTATQTDGGFDSSHKGFGSQIQRLAEALDARDVDGIVALAGRLKESALRQHADPIAEVAESLQRCARQSEPHLLQLVNLTGQLLAIVQDEPANQPPHPSATCSNGS